MPELKCHREFRSREALYRKLEERIQQEKAWIPNKRRFISLGNGEVTFLERDDAVRGIFNLTKMFRMFPNTYSMAVNFLDRFTALLKIRPVHLHCVAVTCVYIAVKLQEEQQYIPDAKGLMEASIKTELGTPFYSHTDLLRMERKVLDKLEWALNPVTPLIMLELYFGIASSEGCLSLEDNGNEELSTLTEQLHKSLTYSSIAMYTPSTIALAVLSLRFCDSAIWTEKLLPLFIEKTQLSVEEYYCCEELIEEMLYSATYDIDSNLNSCAMFKRQHSALFIPSSLSSADDSDGCPSPPTKKPSYAAMVARSLNDSLMSMSL